MLVESHVWLLGLFESIHFLFEAVDGQRVSRVAKLNNIIIGHLRTCRPGGKTD